MRLAKPESRTAAKKTHVVSIGQPAHTDALEFEDGKLMLGKLSPLGEVTWDNLINRVGIQNYSQSQMDTEED